MKREPRDKLCREDWDFTPLITPKKFKYSSVDDPKYRHWLDNLRTCMFYEFARESRLIREGSNEYRSIDNEELALINPGKILWHGKRKSYFDILFRTSRSERVNWWATASSRQDKKMEDFFRVNKEFEERYYRMLETRQKWKKKWMALNVPLVPPFNKIPFDVDYSIPWLKLTESTQTYLKNIMLATDPIHIGSAGDIKNILKDCEGQMTEWKKHPPKSGTSGNILGPEFIIKPCATEDGVDSFIAVIDWYHHGERALVRAFTDLMKRRRRELEISDRKGRHERASEHLKALGVMRMLWCYPDYDLICKNWPDFWKRWTTQGRGKDAVFKTLSELNMNACNHFRKLFPFESSNPIHFMKGEKKRYFRWTPAASERKIGT